MKHAKLSRQILVCAAVLVAATPVARAADPTTASARASAASVLTPSVAGGVLVAGTLSTLQLSGEAVIASVETVADGTVIVLRGASDAGTASVRVATDVVGSVGLVVGTTVRVVAMSTGCALIAAGRMIAFIPNEVGAALVHQSRATALRGER